MWGILITLLILVYIFSIAGTYAFFNQAHKAGGIYHRHDRDMVEETVMAWVPVTNLFFTIDFLKGGAKVKEPLKSIIKDEDEDDYYKIRE